MGRYLLKRFLIIIPVFFGITVLVYVLASLAPGSPIEMLMADPHATEADLLAKRIEFGLDQPVIVQYGKWLLQLLRGNLGTSFRTYRPVIDDRRAGDADADLDPDGDAVFPADLDSHGYDGGV